MTHGTSSGATNLHRYLFVGDDGTFRVVEFTPSGDMDSLDALQKLVDGDIEHLAGTVTPSNGEAPVGVDVWVNEDVRFRSDFEPNIHVIALLAYPWRLVGPAVVTVTDHEGTTHGLPEHLIGAVRNALAETFATELPTSAVDEAAAQQQEVRRKRLATAGSAPGAAAT